MYKRPASGVFFPCHKSIFTSQLRTRTSAGLIYGDCNNTTRASSASLSSSSASRERRCLSQSTAFRYSRRLTNNNNTIMSGLEIELTAPNGRKYKQPTGLFINNEWVKAKKGEKITSINPRFRLPSIRYSIPCFSLTP